MSEKFKAISTKGLTKDLINKFSILNGAKYFFQELIKIIYHFYYQKNALNVSVVEI